MPEILVGFEGADDAGVFQLTEDRALVQTVDFFSPIVDDPFVFGQIAAANALSDVYAMGGKPLTALAIVGFPMERAGPAVLSDIMAGGLYKLNESGVALMGGHSVKDDEVKFGYAVTGIIDPRDICQNKNASVGDCVLLTKPIGTGLISTALKKGKAEKAHVESASRVMVETNRAAAEVLHGSTVRAMTDVTGFGLLGHAMEVARASNLTIEFDHAHVPVLEGALEYSARGFLAGGLKNNRKFFSDNVKWAGNVSEEYRNLFFDPQTSGGLLVFAPEGEAEKLIGRFEESGVEAVKIGLVRDLSDELLKVH